MMSTLAAVLPVAKKHPAGSSKKLARLELRVEQSWLARVQQQADRLGISIASYVRQTVTRQVEADEANAPPRTD